MSALRRLLLFVAAFLGLSAASSQQPAAALSAEDVLFEIVAYYNPTLAEAQPLVHCVVHGGAVDTCGTQFIQGEALEDPNVQRMLGVMDAYDRDAYAEMISLAGVGVACAWISNPPLVCSEFGQVVAEIGAAALAAQYEVGAAVVELFSDAAATVGCWTGVYCDDDDDEPANQYNGAAEWQRCFQPRVQEGLVARLSGGGRWANLLRRQLPSHRFASGSLLGDCYPFISQVYLQQTTSAALLGAANAFAQAPSALPGGAPLSNPWNNANPWAAPPPNSAPSQAEILTTISDFITYASAPLSDQYTQLVEDAAAEAIDEAAHDYSNLQTLWTARPDPQARLALVSMLTNPGPMQAAIPVYVQSQRTSCLTTFDTAQAHMIDRWADAGARAGSARSVRGIDAMNWSSRKPREWCDTYYVAQFTQILTARKAAYDDAIARGCRIVRGNALVMQCPALGGGYQRCRTALQNVDDAQCSFNPLNLRPISPAVPPPATEAPPVVETAPPQPRTPQVRPSPVPPVVLTPQAPPRQRPPG